MGFMVIVSCKVTVIYELLPLLYSDMQLNCGCLSNTLNYSTHHTPCGLAGITIPVLLPPT